MIQVHVTFALIALLVGPTIFLRRKGDRLHRLAGYLFVGAIVLLNVSALTIYDLTGGPNFFHLLALSSLATISFGLIRARRGDIPGHLNLMAWAYAGLIMALATRLAPLLPLPFWLSNLVPILIVSGLTTLALRHLAPSAAR